ncbi:MAG: response regulator [Fuerstiella sp.]
MSTRTPKTAPEDDTQCRMATVLLVDDDAKLLRGLERHLGSEFTVMTAVSPAEANAVIARNNVDVVVSDNLMAGTLGADFLSRLSSEHPEIKLLMLSGYMPDALAQRVMSECRVHQVLTKPCESSVVAEAIRRALAEASTERPTEFPL